MNTALDNFISSIPVEVSASKYHNQSISLDTHRFTCPACGEYVGLVINGFFRHGKRTDESDFCEKRVDSTDSSYSLQYRVGVPIYLRRNTISNDYELKIGFPSIPYDILKIAEDAEITIADKSNIEKAAYTSKYSISRLSPSETTLCELDFIPTNDRSYSLHLSKYGYYLDKYLSNYADGFINNNALFTYHSGEGRKIHKGYNKNEVYADIFVYDSLSSGAGYSYGVVKNIDMLLAETRNVLSSCTSNCEDTCHNCLSNYQNKKNQHIMNRFNALQLLDWTESGSIAREFSEKEQERLVSGVNEWLNIDGRYSIVGEHDVMYVVGQNIKQKLYIYPAMWNDSSKSIPENCIAIPDVKLKKAMPEAVSIIINAVLK